MAAGVFSSVVHGMVRRNSARLTTRPVLHCRGAASAGRRKGDTLMATGDLMLIFM